MNETRKVEYSTGWIDELDVSAKGGARGGNAMQGLRRLLLFAGIALCLLGGAAVWRALHPPLSDEEAVATQLETMRTGIEKRQAGSITQHVADDFKWNDMDGKTFRAAVGQVLLQWRDVQLTFSNRRVEVRGDSATTAGRYSLSVREEPKAKVETYNGSYDLQWQKRNGRWQITNARGGENLPGIGGASSGEF